MFKKQLQAAKYQQQQRDKREREREREERNEKNIKKILKNIKFTVNKRRQQKAMQEKLFMTKGKIIIKWKRGQGRAGYCQAGHRH